MQIFCKTPCRDQYYFPAEGKKLCLDATFVDPLEPGKNLNHSRLNPNLKACVLPGSKTRDNIPKIYFIAKKDIAPFSYLTFDYGDHSRHGPEWLRNT